MLFFIIILEDVAGLAVEYHAQGIECGETDCLRLTRFQDRQVRYGYPYLL